MHNKDDPKFIIVDANCVCHLAKHSMKDLTYDDQDTGVIFGFFGQILKYAMLLKTNRFIFCWDSAISLRECLFPQYKHYRKDTNRKTEEERDLDKIALPQFNLIRTEILPYIGFKNNFWQDGYEGDDIIAKICYTNGFEKVIISTDHDLYQLLDDRTMIYNPRKKAFYTLDDFKNEFSLDPFQWSEILAITGCKSDEIPGIAGIGTFRATNYIKGTASTKVKMKIQSREGREITNRNRPLVKLPFRGIKQFPIRKQQPLSRANFTKICQRYGFSYFLRQEVFKKWVDVMELI